MEKCMLIKNGRIVDPARGINQAGDIFVENGKVVEHIHLDRLKDGSIIDAGGCLVVPGLIDLHAHLFFRGTDAGIPADAALLPSGVTTAVDGGSAGSANYELFQSSVVATSMVRIKSFLNVSPGGLATARHEEPINPKSFDRDKIAWLFRQYPDHLIGLKLRQSRGVVGELGLDPLKAAIEISENLFCPVAVHTTDPPSATEDLVELLRPGDIFVHAYHGVGNTILGANRHVLPAVRKARERGVLFDAANGRNHFSFDTAFAALADGFEPDIISTDLTTLTWNKPPVYSLPFVISKYLNMGMALPAALAACTAVPARLLGMTGIIGTLAPGAEADIAILRLEERETEFLDARGQKHLGNQLLIPQATVKAGRIVYRNCGSV